LTGSVRIVNESVFFNIFFGGGVIYRLLQKRTPGTKGSKDVRRKGSQTPQRKITTKAVAAITTATKTITVTKTILPRLRRTIPK
jgi:hypothetical protein